MEYSLIGLIIAAGLAFIPANIAKNKGHSFGLWWFYGWMLFIVAIIHVQFIEDYTKRETEKNEKPIYVADELKKFKELYDGGAITQEEYEAKKSQLLGL
ncbi:MAG: SHOCT domain-containing protein [Oribacterium sp.]|nr:SHOCT domain-containing protein [Oribacterium sp.]